jgi:transposase
LPVAVCLSSGNVGDLNACQGILAKLPAGCQVTADRAYDANWFREKLAGRGIQANIARRSFNSGKGHFKPGEPPPNPVTYKNRWLVERCFAWCEKYKRLIVRYEKQSRLYLAFWQLGCAMIILGRLLG